MAIDAVKVFSRGEGPDSLVLFAGEPKRLRGQLWLENSHHAELHLHQAYLVSQRISPVDKGSGHQLTRIPVPATMVAHERKFVTVSFAIDSSTRPGTYEAEIHLEGDLGTQTVPAQIVVTQDYSLSIHPDELVVMASAGSKVADEVIVVRNDGNVPVVVTPIGECPLRDPLRAECVCICTDRDGGIHFSSSKQSEARESAEPEDEFGSIVVENEEMVVAPGAWALVRFSVRLPDSLPGNVQLRARPRIGTKRFTIDVITSADDSAGPPKPDSKRRRKA